jgi:Kef-type K+ transport system membrane component KefB
MDNSLFLNILIILVLAKLGGEFIVRFGYPSVVAEIATGIILGPSILGIIYPTESLGILSELGFILVLLYAGLHLDVSQLFEASRYGVLVALVSVPATIASGYAVGRLFGYSNLTSLSIGSAMAISSVGMGARVLVDLDRLRTPAGMTLISSAVADDVLGVAALGMLVSITKVGYTSSHIINLALGVGVFFIIFFVVGFVMKLPEKLVETVNKSRTMGTKISYVFIVLFAIMSLAEFLGVHVIIGAFFAGLMLNRGFLEDLEIHKSIMIFTFGLFAPLAYSWVGLNTVLMTLVTNLSLLVVILFVGFASRIISGFFASRLSGLDWKDSLIVGVGLTGRAGIELAVIEVLRSTGLIGLEIYSSFVILTAVACIAMPLMLKYLCSWIWRI